VRLLIEVRDTGRRGLTREDVLRAYRAETIIDARLGRLLAAGQISEQEGVT